MVERRNVVNRVVEGRDGRYEVEKARDGVGEHGDLAADRDRKIEILPVLLAEEAFEEGAEEKQRGMGCAKELFGLKPSERENRGAASG